MSCDRSVSGWAGQPIPLDGSDNFRDSGGRVSGRFVLGEIESVKSISLNFF